MLGGWQLIATSRGGHEPRSSRRRAQTALFGKYLHATGTPGSRRDGTWVATSTASTIMTTNNDDGPPGLRSPSATTSGVIATTPDIHYKRECGRALLRYVRPMPAQWKGGKSLSALETCTPTTVKPRGALFPRKGRLDNLRDTGGPRLHRRQKGEIDDRSKLANLCKPWTI